MSAQATGHSTTTGNSARSRSSAWLHIPPAADDASLIPFTRSPVHPFTRSPAHPFTRSPAHPTTRSPLPSPLRPPVHPFTRSPVHPFTPCRRAQPRGPPRRPRPEEVVAADRAEAVQDLTAEEEPRHHPAFQRARVHLAQRHPAARHLRLLV